jgi:hypothetical protein
MAKLGGIDPGEIAEIARNVRPSDEAGASADERFVRAVIKLVEHRREVGELAGFSVFLRSQAVHDDVKDRQKVALPLMCSGNDPVSQRVVISDALLVRAYSLDIIPNNDIFDMLEACALGHHATLVVDWRGDSPKAIFWPRGVAGGDPVELYLADHEITPEEMKAILDDFYTARLRTPQTITEGHGQRVWTKPSQGWPADRPEEQIQGILIAFLRGRLRHDIRPEQPNSEGRLDVQISARLHDANGDRIVKKIWILELKALTDKTTDGGDVAPGLALAGLQKGVNQAYSYREAEHANRAALCCYDMRKDDWGDEIVFEPILKEANDHAVYLWRWFLHRSSHAARVAAAEA